MPEAVVILAKILLKNGIWTLALGWLLAVGGRITFERAERADGKAGPGFADFKTEIAFGTAALAVGLALNVVIG